jgi:DNA-binding CsgD family transcriptional regulator
VLAGAPMNTNGEVAWRRLLGEIADRPGPPGARSDESKVVFATVIDGVRYSLIRSVETPGHPGVHDESACRCGLSAREHEIARMVAKGYTNKTIAAVLDISTWTVDTYLRRIFTKLGVRSRSAMVNQLTREGALDEHEVPEWSEALRTLNGNGRRSA